jgi:signal transduction histidine kinase
MKVVGGYSYLNAALVSLIFVEAVLNQPYNFFLKRVNLYRFQFYQMFVDIVSISWVIYYMGGIEAPIVNIGYYVVILWAGVVSDISAVFFAVVVSVIMYTAVIILGHFGIFPHISHFSYVMPLPHLFSLLLGHVSFLFAFGYFSARSSQLAKQLERRKQEESLRHTHKFLAAGYLVGSIAHDIINHLVAMRAYVEILLEKASSGPAGDDQRMMVDGLKHIKDAERNSVDLLAKLMQFSQKPKEKFVEVDLHHVIDDALELTLPIRKMADIETVKEFVPQSPMIMGDKDQVQEVFVAMILNAIDAMPKKGKLIIRTLSLLDNELVKVEISDTGVGIKRDQIERISEPFFTTKESGKAIGLGLTIAYGIVARHKGKIEVQSTLGVGTTFTLLFPMALKAT